MDARIIFTCVLLFLVVARLARAHKASVVEEGAQGVLIIIVHGFLGDDTTFPITFTVSGVFPTTCHNDSSRL